MTHTDTSTATFTNTRTNTPTETWTGTPPPTWTNTDTFTNTNTPTFTNTYTNSFTMTYTNTRTDTPTETWTVTITWTGTPAPTWTNTSTFTDTNTATETSTSTNTYTGTDTFTFTSTNSPTNTFTATVTPTDTNTATHTYTQTFTNTQTHTGTATDTWTVTDTNTSTNTFTYTFTWTQTMTFTNTPTITMTLPPYPFILTIDIYNEAGEKVKHIIKTPISDNINSEIILLLKGEESKIWDKIFNPEEGVLIMKIPGIETPDQRDKGYSEFIWDGKNNSGQETGNGVYYIKFTIQDKYGHTDVIIKDITLLKKEQYVLLSIYNTAGELVRRIEKDNPETEILKLNIPDFLYITSETSAVEINYAEGKVIKWDGLNSKGEKIANGIYEIQVELKTEQGYKIIASKTISIISEKIKKILGDIKIYPDPCYVLAEGNKMVKIKWTEVNKGRVNVKIYNIKGEMIRKIDSDLETGFLLWDMKTSSGAQVASGIYIVIVEGKLENGEREIKKAKLTIVKKNKPKNDMIN